jgi:hypothetical protein
MELLSCFVVEDGCLLDCGGHADVVPANPHLPSIGRRDHRLSVLAGAVQGTGSGHTLRVAAAVARLPLGSGQSAYHSPSGFRIMTG